MAEEMLEVDLDLPRMEVISFLCKGCGLCVANCPRKCIEIGEKFNELGYKHANYKGEGCIGCATCFYCCPEPGAIIVYKKVREKK